MTQPEHKLTPPPERVSAGGNAQLTFMNRNLESLARNQQALLDAIREESKQIRARQDHTDSAVSDLREEFRAEFKRSRAVTRLWTTFGLSFAGLIIKYAWEKLSNFALRIF